MIGSDKREVYKVIAKVRHYQVVKENKRRQRKHAGEKQYAEIFLLYCTQDAPIADVLISRTSTISFRKKKISIISFLLRT